jgi:hypothetical protein
LSGWRFGARESANSKFGSPMARTFDAAPIIAVAGAAIGLVIVARWALQSQSAAGIAVWLPGTPPAWYTNSLAKAPEWLVQMDLNGTLQTH